MSNTIVGSVYQQIIDKVIQASQNDFEEFGVDQSTLDEMKEVCGNISVLLPSLFIDATAFSFSRPMSHCVCCYFPLKKKTRSLFLLALCRRRERYAAWHWLEVRLGESGAEVAGRWQTHLSNLKIAAFPWDPQQEPPRQPPTVPSNVKQEIEVSPVVSAPQQETANFTNVGVKAERVYEPPISAYPQVPVNGYTSGLNDNIAHQRANALIAQRLGQGGHNMQQHQQHSGQVPMHSQQRMIPPQLQQQRAQQMQQRPHPGHVYTSQTDGSDGVMEDWNALVAAKAAEGDDGPNGRTAADRLMRAHVDAMAARQDSGLMMPLDEMPKGRKRKAAMRVLQAQQAEASSSCTSVVPRVAPFDGELDGEDVKEENPEDAINSDLDDPDDDLEGDGDNDDDNVDYMLCTYDKVQRVKNKWKCVLKDGVLTTNKKEFLFHKATGEFEW
ncbi:TFIIA-domain-containing protein [Lindgomyces ingoldianus]|uniref:TFIIA-domain-containing protein n=1 Tax=Lindgomyces ingoldianus TaxID=673940 RepID=A0ACB6QVP2_9PLEO|nr:TFIIA-domain-containing protein [Lindgomyces ingoldianus]KAF2471001.1 TFIIA-domain-containing protein [Lindgomyces ingoldianus]